MATLFKFRCLQILVLVTAGVLTTGLCTAQQKGILPVTGIKYFNEGISAKTILVKMDGAEVLSNRFPLNKEIEISLQQPAGFSFDKNKTVYAAAELSLVSVKGDLLFRNPNLFLNNEATGFAPKNFKAPAMHFVLTTDLLRSNTSAIIMIRVYDLKGKNQLRLEFPVTIARYGEVVPVSKTIKTIKTSPGFSCIINGLKVGKLKNTIDTSIKVVPTMAYASMEISNIEGTSIGGIFGGKEKFWVYDADLNEIPIRDILLKDVGGAMENNIVNYILKIPFRLKTAAPKGYTVRFRWEGADKTQVIDVVVTI